MLSADIHPRKNHLYAAITGEYSLRHAQDAYRRALQIAVDHGLSRILIDCSRIVGVPSMSERRDFGIFQAEEHARLRPQLGDDLQIVIFGSAPFIDPGRYGEAVAQNRGVRMKAVERLEEALRWLGVGEKSGSDPDLL